jgi:superfamily II DNA helicase RecQ
MQFKIFSVNVNGDTPSEEAMNKFLRSHRILSVQKELCGDAWCFCVEYFESGDAVVPSSFSPKRNERVDYREVLSESDFAVYSAVRDLRKKLAAVDAVPVYTVCTNEHLAQMVTDKCTTLSALQKIPGFGEAKIKKYGKQFLEILTASLTSGTNETGTTL